MKKVISNPIQHATKRNKAPKSPATTFKETYNKYCKDQTRFEHYISPEHHLKHSKAYKQIIDLLSQYPKELKNTVLETVAEERKMNTHSESTLYMLNTLAQGLNLNPERMLTGVIELNTALDKMCSNIINVV